MSAAPHPKVSRSPSLPLVWIVPIVALAVGAWMIFRELRSRGPEITIEFSDGAGMEAGKTALEHKGVPVGMVTSVDLKPDLSGTVVKLRLRSEAEALARTGSQFWIVHPEIGFSGVRGIDTLLTGVRLNVKPGTGAPAKHFQGLDQPPAAENPELGRAFTLWATKLGSITQGAPVLYREVKVGTVETTRLADDGASVVMRIRVYTPYIDLVRSNTQFWNTGGVSLHLSLLGANVKTSSLESLFTGGVAFATPDGPLATQAEDGATFKLNEEAEKEWLKWQPRIPIKPKDLGPEQKPTESVPAALTGGTLH